MYGTSSPSSLATNIEDGAFHRGALLISLKTIVPYYNQSIRTTNVEPVTPINLVSSSLSIIVRVVIILYSSSCAHGLAYITEFCIPAALFSYFIIAKMLYTTLVVNQFNNFISFIYVKYYKIGQVDFDFISNKQFAQK